MTADLLSADEREALERIDQYVTAKDARTIAAALRRLSAAPSAVAGGEGFDFAAHLAHQAAWSEQTFGPGKRTAGVCDHIRKELIEVEADPEDTAEWIDVVILALDGAWRSGMTPEQIIAGIIAKQRKNEGRAWPDWRTAPQDKAIEHDRTKDSPAPESAPKAGAQAGVVAEMRSRADILGPSSPLHHALNKWASRIEAADPKGDFRVCDKCGCRTNAALRLCCDEGRAADIADPKGGEVVLDHCQQISWKPRSDGKRFWKVFTCRQCGQSVEGDHHLHRQCPAYTRPQSPPMGEVTADDVIWLLSQMRHSDFDHDFQRDADKCERCKRRHRITAALQSESAALGETK